MTPDEALALLASEQLFYEFGQFSGLSDDEVSGAIADTLAAEVRALRATLELYAKHENWTGDASSPDRPRIAWIGANGHGWEPAEKALGLITHKERT
jgi:hypothetical protein